MASSSVLLASAGEDVRIWTMPDLNLSSIKNGTNANVVSCSCSGNGQLVAYAHEENGLTVANLTDETAPLVTIPTGCEQSSVAFNGSSKFLVSGGLDSIINIWDIKTRVAKRTYKEHVNPVSCCLFNYNDTVMASGSTKGELLFINVQSGLASDPLLGADSQVIRGLAYSYFQRHLLASVSDSGALSLWDAKEKKLLKTFQDHKAPATGLTFSPLNDMLLCSTGLDKKIIFYDVTGKKTVKTINTEGPVTCCDFMHDGCTVAAGSASGRIYLFDLRQGSTPVKVQPAHKTSIRSLSFQKIPKDSKSPRRPVEESRVPRQRHNSDGGEKDTTPVNNGHRNLSRETSTSSIELYNTHKMPSKENSSSDLFVNRENSTVALRNVIKQNKAETPMSAKAQKILGDDIFSPIATDPMLTKTIASRQKSVPKTHNVRPQSTTTEENVDIRPNYGRSKSSVSKLSIASKSTEDLRSKLKDLNEKDNQDGGGKKGGLFKSPFKKKTHVKNAFTYNKHSDESETSSIESFSLDDKKRGKKDRSSDRSNDSGNKAIYETGRLSPYGRNIDTNQLMNDIQNSLASGINKSPSSHSADFVHLYPPSEGGPSQFQIEVVQRMIDDAMEENRMAIHDDMVNLQIEMLRQMEIQKAQVRTMLQEYSINDELVAEIERLRAENERLRTKY